MNSVNSCGAAAALRILPAILCALCFGLCAGCDGGDGDDNAEGQVRGTLATATAAVPGVTVCALGDCALTDGQGDFELNRQDAFGGGEVLFTFEGGGLDTQAVADLPAVTTEDIHVGFLVSGNNVTPTGAVIDDVSGTVGEDEPPVTEIHGLLQTAAGPLPGVTVCAVSVCSTTSPRGNFQLEVPQDTLPSGPVTFTFEGSGLSTQAVADLPATNDAPPDPEHLEVVFFASGNSVTATRVVAH